MKKDRILIFNRLTTHDSLKDVSAFESFVGNFYYEFSHLYNIIANDDILDNVDDIWCKLYSDRIEFYLELSKSASLKKISKKLNKAIQNEIEYIDAHCWEHTERCLTLASA
jgi:hypothetical protein